MNINVRNFSRICIMLIAVMAMVCGVRINADVIFPTTSELIDGHWVKIDFSGTGMYEIYYSQLRDMGFPEPEKVAVFGRGGQIQPMQFTDANGIQQYYSTLSPVAMLHSDGKIIFFGQGTEVIRQIQTNKGKPAAQQFELVSKNSYASYSSYYLTDSRTDGFTPERAALSLNSQLPHYTHGWQVIYHDEDFVSPINSGREYFGESLKDNSPQFLYSMPGGEEGDPVSITLRAVQGNTDASATVTGVLSSGDSSRTKSISLDERNTGDYYSTSSTPWFATTLPGAEGTLELSYSGAGTWAYLDYYIIAAKTKLGFTSGQTSIMAYVSDFSSSEYSMLDINNVPSDMIVWDIATPSDAYDLPWQQSGANACVKYIRDNKQQGMIVAFSPSATHKHIDRWSTVSCQNLHSIGTNAIPDMLIITLPEFLPAAERIAALHKRVEGLDTRIVLSDNVIAEFSGGVPDPMAYRAIAKMIYDRDDPYNRKFKNLLLLGPCVRDNRNITSRTPFGTLICNQSFMSMNVDNSFTLNDWYGMMADHTTFTPDAYAYNFSKVPMEIGVGNIPCRDLIDAYTYVEKLEAFYADDSFAYWLNEASYVADSADNNEHQNLTDMLHQNMMIGSHYAFVGSKLFNNLYCDRGTTHAFCRRLAEGSILNYYLGHSDPSTLSGEFWYFKDERLLANHRLGFMTFASCTVTEFDANNRGTGESLVFLPGKGLVGGFMTTRSGYSFSNYALANLFQRALIHDNLSNEEVYMLSSPRTVGEAYAMAKSAYTNNANKLAYVLICDPALTLPMPTAGIDLSVNGNATGEASRVYPHQEISIDGAVRDRAGRELSGFQGAVVVKVYNAPVIRPTTPRKGADVVDVEIDESPVCVSSFIVKGGHFAGKITLPSTMTPCDDTMAIVRLAAYDPATRTAAAGSRRINVQPYDKGHAVSTDNAPVIEAMYANTPDFNEGETVAPSFTLYADITDDHGVMAYTVNSLSALTLMIDGRRSLADLNQYITLEDGGRRCRIAYPVSDLNHGIHTLKLTALDAEGQQATRSMSLCVGEAVLYGALDTDGAPARTSATFSFTPSGEAYPELACTIVVLDACSREIYSAPMNDLTHEWDLKDNTGNRVTPGVYTAICRLSAKHGRQGASAPCRITVF